VHALMERIGARGFSGHTVPSFHWKLRLAVTTLPDPFLQSGNLRASLTAAASSTCSPVMMQPDCAPFSRRMRVNLRVSTPAMATTRPRSRNSDQ